MIEVVIENEESILPNDVVNQISNCRNIVVYTGAGISQSTGIPTYRGKRRKLNYDAGSLLIEHQRIQFYRDIADLKDRISQAQPTPTHRFIEKLRDDNKLLLHFTQNIDCLGESDYQLHGSLAQVICNLCRGTCEFSQEVLEAYKNGVAPQCKKCSELAKVRQTAGKRKCTWNKCGILLPNIVLYQQEHPNGEEIEIIHQAKMRRKPDLMIVIGTSLQVPGFQKLVKTAAKNVHTNGGICMYSDAKLLSKRSQWRNVLDYQIVGNCDVFVNLVEKQLGQPRVEL